jgi:hypothetical protein
MPKATIAALLFKNSRRSIIRSPLSPLVLAPHRNALRNREIVYIFRQPTVNFASALRGALRPAGFLTQSANFSLY